MIAEDEERAAIRAEAAPERDELVDGALELARRGWAVIDLYGLTPALECSCWLGDRCTRSPGKHPRPRDGFRAGTKDRRELAARWRAGRTPPNVGIVTGAISGVVVLDVDPRNGGDHRLAAAIAARGTLPETLRVATGGGGVHFYFAHPGGLVPCRKLFGNGSGLDVKADGGLVVAPPSLHTSGRRYVLELDVAPAPLEGWLRDELLAAPIAQASTPPRRSIGHYGDNIAARVRRAAAYIDKMPPAISGAGGHDATWRVALTLVQGYALPQAVALELLRHFNATRCKPPWGERELAHKLENAAQSRLPSGYLARERRA